MVTKWCSSFEQTVQICQSVYIYGDHIKRRTRGFFIDFSITYIYITHTSVHHILSGEAC